IKKPVICTLKEGTPITTWKATATQTELTAAGFPIVDVKQSASSGNQKYLPPANHGGSHGKGGVGTAKQVDLFPKNQRTGGDVGLLNGFNPVPFPAIPAGTISDGRAYFSADYNHSTIIFKLIDTHTRQPLVGWTVNFEDHPEEKAFTAYNGLGVFH